MTRDELLSALENTIQEQLRRVDFHLTEMGVDLEQEQETDA